MARQRPQSSAVRLPNARSGRHDDLPEGPDAVRAPVTDAATATVAVTPVATALPADVERKLAALVGIEPVVPEPTVDDEAAAEPWYDEANAAHFAHRVLRVAQQVTVGSLLLLVVCAVVAARVDGSSLHAHPRALALAAIAAAVCAVSVAALVTDPDVAGGLSAAKRRTLGSILMAGLLVAVTCIVASAGGAAGPAWVLFLPIVVVAGAVLGPTLGLLVGALSGTGIYVAAGISASLSISGIGRLVVILPACPLFGWAAGALAGAAHHAAARARGQRLALLDDVRRLTEVLDEISAGDLSSTPVLERPADQATATLAVVFADTVLSLRRLVRQLSDVTGHLSRNADELAASASNHLAAVEQQASAVAETTSTIEQLAATATTISETAERVSRFAGRTRVDVDEGAKSVAQSTASMVAIGRRVQELGSRTSRLDERVTAIATTARLIDEIARRTTMLALNAAIEAARVGQYGYGFDTVATEIGELAMRARRATASIAAVVGELEQEVSATAAVSREGMAAVEEGLERQRLVEAALVHISDRVDDTTRAARDITSATRQQRVASDAVVQAMQRVTGASHGATSATRTHAVAAQRLRTLIEAMRTSVARFRLG